MSLGLIAAAEITVADYRRDVAVNMMADDSSGEVVLGAVAEAPSGGCRRTDRGCQVAGADCRRDDHRRHDGCGLAAATSRV